MTVLKTGNIQIYMMDGWMDWIGWIGSQTAIAARASLNRAVLIIQCTDPFMQAALLRQFNNAAAQASFSQDGADNFLSDPTCWCG